MLFTLNIIKQKRVYFFLILLFILSCGAFLLSQSKSAGFIFLHNIPHNNFINFIFTCITFIGNGFFVIGLGVLLVFIKSTKLLGINVIISYLLSGLIAQLIKSTVKMPRPKEFFNLLNIKIDLPNAHLGFSSFPSGHTTTAFALTTILCIYFNNKSIQIPLLIIAVLAGYSRIYLGHHFLEDVLLGSIIGTTSALFTANITKTTKFQSLLNPNK
jgi:membrane-associated phospholipid phosphatase